MGFDLRIKGVTSGNGAEVDVNNKLKVNLPDTDIDAGHAVIIAENDSGSITGSRAVKAVEISHDFRTRVATDTMIFNEHFPGTAFNTATWTQVVTTMTTTVATGFANLNAGASVASAAVARVQTWRSFPIYKTFTNMTEMEVQFTETPVAGNVCEWGHIICTGTSAPTDGAFFRLNSSGEFRCVINFNGSETQSAALDFSALVGVNSTKQFLIYAGSQVAKFWIDNVLVATIDTPVGQGALTASMNIPLCFRNYNSSATSVAQIMKVGNTNVTIGDLSPAKQWPHILAGLGGVCYQGQTSGTMGTTALYTNSLAAGAGAALTNTTAAAGSGLGGQFSVQPTLAAGTDGVLSSYQVPAGTAAVPGKSLYITGVRIQGAVTTVLVGGPVIYAFSLGFGNTAVSLATAEAATTKASRRIALGFDVFVAAAAVGTIGQIIQHNFETPILVQPGEFIQTIAKNLGTVTSSGVITYLVTFQGYFE